MSMVRDLKDLDRSLANIAWRFSENWITVKTGLMK